MKLTINNRNLSVPDTLDSLIQTRLRLLGNRVRIDEATILLERRPESSPSFRVEMMIAVPGPDLRAEARDSTPFQAFSKALGDIEHRLRLRDRKRQPGARALRTSTPSSRATSFR